MKLDASALRYLTKEDFRILSALEIGSKNHEVVPLTMIASLARIRPGGANSKLSELAKHKLVSKEHHTSYEGFRLTYGGYDYLALHALSMRGSVEGVGRQIGVGKESDVYLVTGRYPTTEEDEGDLMASGDEDDRPVESFVLKIERLGRTSFRTVKSNRDYVGKRKHVSWMYMSRLAAEKEWAFLKALHSHGFPTPRPVDWSRHCIVMGYVDGRPLDNLHPEDWPQSVPLVTIASYLYGILMGLLVRIAEHGLIHGDFNEFNLMIKESFIESPTFEPVEDFSKVPVVMIDFPQMISTSHENAQELFDRDVNCLRVFFARRFGFEAAEWPNFEKDVSQSCVSLDRDLKASGFRGRDDDECEFEDSEETDTVEADSVDDSDGSEAMRSSDEE